MCLREIVSPTGWAASTQATAVAREEHVPMRREGAAPPAPPCLGESRATREGRSVMPVEKHAVARLRRHALLQWYRSPLHKQITSSLY